jgi:hypothetical protein
VNRVIFIAVALCGCGGTVATTPVEAGVLTDANVDATLPMLDPCPAMPDLQPKIPCTELGRVCEYSYGNIEPLCAGAQTCLLDGGWQDTRTAHPCVNMCPASPPSGNCGSTPFGVEICSYPDAGVDCVCANCTAPVGNPMWQCFGPSAVCAKRPQLGTGCSDPAAQCEYPPSCCGAFVQKCERGVWMQEPQQGCPP